MFKIIRISVSPSILLIVFTLKQNTTLILVNDLFVKDENVL